MNIYRFGIITAIILALAPGTSHAVWYQVEAIVFEHINPVFDGEDWRKTPGLVPLDDSVGLVPEFTADEANPASDAVSGVSVAIPTLIPYARLPESKNRLENIYRVLRASRDYRPLYHISWQQPGLDGNSVRAVHLQAEDPNNLFEMTIPPILVTGTYPIDFYEPIKLLFDGIVRIRSSLYLHIDVDMVLFRQPPAVMFAGTLPGTGIDGNMPAPVVKPVDFVRLKESRRIKLNELQYFDHPMFGIILQVSRYDGEE